MPELPEVEIVRRGIEPVLQGRVLSRVVVNRADLRVPVPHDFADAIAGRRVSAVQRRGKYILVFVEGGAGFVLHLGMSGRIYVHAPDTLYKPEKHDHVVFVTEEGAQLAFNDARRFGMLYLTSFEGWAQEKPFSLMGVEPLGNEFSGEALAAKLARRGVPIKAALLDQRIVAGVGNIYASEALFEAKIDPLRAAGSLSAAEVEALAQAVRNVLTRAIEAGGSSLRDYAHTDGTLGYFQHQFSVYDREGSPCPVCGCGSVDHGGDGIRRIVQSGRSTFYCPQCQG